MQVLCIKMAELLRKHPILWLPYFAADLLAICLWRLRGVAERGIFRWFTTRRSVLGGDIALPRHDSATLAKASIAYAPIGIITIVAVVWLFAAALVATADIVDAIRGEQRGLDKTEILAHVAAHWRRILLFSLRFLITIGVFVAGTTGLSYYLLFLTHRQDLLTSFWFLTAQILVGVGCTAWLVMPATIRLLEGAAVLVPPQTKRQGTILAMLAAATGSAIGYFLPKLESSMLLSSRWETTAFSFFGSVIANAPDALLFIALALLATELPSESVGENGSKIRELLLRLMPLHFGKSEEPPQLEP